ncbi:MAG TPA: TonB family protein [Bryobacteraceae bacterium]|nr:TonB family protein [Bryobacteraceae bacterium]
MTAITQALSTALLDFVWQGLLMAFLLWIALYLLKDRSARARYAAGCAALAAMALMPVVTAFLVYNGPSAPHAVGLIAPAPHASSSAAAAAAGGPFNWDGWLVRWALPAWFAGVLAFSLRLVWASRRISALRSQSQPPDSQLLAVVEGLAERMNLARPVRVLMAAGADCPSVIGWIRPVVLLPAATVLGLTPRQLEAVLAHELAHILRYDHVVNMLQTVVETLLFYHPAVWWASARIRQERELCCDDLAVASCGDALCYARALTRLERLRVTPGLVLASTGGPLLYRIRRILGEAGQGPAPAKLPGILALALGLVCLALNMPNLQVAHGQQQTAAVEASAAENGVPDDPGVQVDLGGAGVIHRESVEYPAPAMEKKVQGTVIVEATLDAEGVVSDARVLSGPQELRKAALASVLQWHFTNGAAGSTRQVSIAFQMPPEGLLAERSQIRAKRRAEEAELAGAAHMKVVPDRALRRELSRNMEQQMRIVRDQAAVSADQAKELAEMAQRLQSGQSADAEKLALEKQLAARQYAELAQSLQSSDGEKLARNKQLYEQRALELENQLGNLKALQDQRQAEFANGALVLSDEQGSQIAQLKKRLAELRNGMPKLDGRIFEARQVKSVTVIGLTSALRDQLLAQLPVHVGDSLTAESFEKIMAAVKRFDEHLGVSMIVGADGQAEIRITAPGSSDGIEAHT